MREALSAVGPYFAVSLPQPGEQWRPVSDLVHSPQVWQEHGSAVRTALGGAAIPFRVALSVAHLGVVGRLVSPTLAAAVLEQRLVLPVAGRWLPQVGGPLPLALTDEALEGSPYDGSLVDALHRRLVEEVLAPLVDTVAQLSISRKVLWGNVASAVNGASTMMATARPDLVPAVRLLAESLLSKGSLRGTSLGAPGVRFRRRSCCLLHLLSEPARRSVCGDCVLQV